MGPQGDPQSGKCSYSDSLSFNFACLSVVIKDSERNGPWEAGEGREIVANSLYLAESEAGALHF